MPRWLDGSDVPSPAFNTREAFCARGCHTAFYRKRCLVCEGPIDRSRDDQKICRKAKCRKGPKAALKRDPRSVSWLVVAGPPEGISANAYHCAIVGADA